MKPDNKKHHKHEPTFTITISHNHISIRTKTEEVKHNYSEHVYKLIRAINLNILPPCLSEIFGNSPITICVIVMMRAKQMVTLYPVYQQTVNSSKTLDLRTDNIDEPEFMHSNLNVANFYADVLNNSDSMRKMKSIRLGRYKRTSSDFSSKNVSSAMSLMTTSNTNLSRSSSNLLTNVVNLSTNSSDLSFNSNLLMSKNQAVPEISSSKNYTDILSTSKNISISSATTNNNIYNNKITIQNPSIVNLSLPTIPHNSDCKMYLFQKHKLEDYNNRKYDNVRMTKKRQALTFNLSHYISDLRKKKLQCMAEVYSGRSMKCLRLIVARRNLMFITCSVISEKKYYVCLMRYGRSKYTHVDGNVHIMKNKNYGQVCVVLERILMNLEVEGFVVEENVVNEKCVKEIMTKEMNNLLGNKRIHECNLNTNNVSNVSDSDVVSKKVKRTKNENVFNKSVENDSLKGMSNVRSRNGNNKISRGEYEPVNNNERNKQSRSSNVSSVDEDYESVKNTAGNKQTMINKDYNNRMKISNKDVENGNKKNNQMKGISAKNINEEYNFNAKQYLINDEFDTLDRTNMNKQGRSYSKGNLANQEVYHGKLGNYDTMIQKSGGRIINEDSYYYQTKDLKNKGGVNINNPPDEYKYAVNYGDDPKYNMGEQILYNKESANVKGKSKILHEEYNYNHAGAYDNVEHQSKVHTNQTLPTNKGQKAVKSHSRNLSRSNSRGNMPNTKMKVNDRRVSHSFKKPAINANSQSQNIDKKVYNNYNEQGIDQRNYTNIYPAQNGRTNMPHIDHYSLKNNDYYSNSYKISSKHNTPKPMQANYMNDADMRNNYKTPNVMQSSTIPENHHNHNQYPGTSHNIPINMQHKQMSENLNYHPYNPQYMNNQNAPQREYLVENNKNLHHTHTTLDYNYPEMNKMSNYNLPYNNNVGSEMSSFFPHNNFGYQEYNPNLYPNETIMQQNYNDNRTINEKKHIQIQSNLYNNNNIEFEKFAHDESEKEKNEQTNINETNDAGTKKDRSNSSDKNDTNYDMNGFYDF